MGSSRFEAHMQVTPFIYISSALLTACTSSTKSSDSGADQGSSEPVEHRTIEVSWSETTHPCVGNRTDALWCDDASTCFVGCGTTTNGQGMYTTSDGGESWDTLSTSPAGLLDDMRVNSISRSSNGHLYIGGNGPGDNRVVSMDSSGNLTVEHEAQGQTWNTFQVGSFRRADNGFAISESLTGSDIISRTSDTEGWTDHYGWWADDNSAGLQVLDMESLGNAIYGCGSTINTPPQVMIPSTDGNVFESVQLANGDTEYPGEMWGIDAHTAIIAVGGVNQERDVGMSYHAPTSGNLSSPDTWRAFDFSVVLPDKATWVRDVCIDSDASYIAVVEDPQLSEGYVFRIYANGSSDDLTVYGENGRTAFPVPSRCMVVNGRVVVAGKNGWFAHFDL